MAFSRSWIERSELVKNIVEIVAITLAGIWALLTFVIKDSPSLRQATACETKIYINPLNEKKVILVVEPSFKNLGQQVINIDSAKIDYWLLPTAAVTSKPYFSADDHIRRHNPDFWLVSYSLSGKYTTDQERHQAFDFFIEGNPDQMVIVRSLFYISKDKLFYREASFVYSYAYRYCCVPDN